MSDLRARIAAAMPEDAIDTARRCTEPDCCPQGRVATSNTHGSWTTCDDCGQNWWCVPTEWDWLNEPVSWSCSGGCDDGWDDGR